MELQALNAIMSQESPKAESMTPLETKLAAALRANARLREEGERLVAAYVAPDSDRAAVIDELIRLFDGPAQREAERLTREALATRFTTVLRIDLRSAHPPEPGAARLGRKASQAAQRLRAQLRI